MGFGSRIKQLRKAQKMTQEDLGKVLGVTKASISGYENETREPDIKTLLKLSDYFQVTVDYLLAKNPELNGDWPTQSSFEAELTADEKRQLKDFINYLASRRQSHSSGDK